MLRVAASLCKAKTECDNRRKVALATLCIKYGICCLFLSSSPSFQTRQLLARTDQSLIWKMLCLPLASKQPCRELPLQGLLHLLVAQAVDEGGEHGGYDGVTDRHPTWPLVSSVGPWGWTQVKITVL